MRKLALVAAALAVSSCSVMIKTPMTRFESPEVRGKPGGLDAMVGYQGRSEVVLTPSIISRPPSMDTPTMDSPGHRLMAEGAVGLGKNFDINLTFPEARLGVKYQILGAPYEDAEAGNIPLAISTSIAAVKEEETSGSRNFKLKEVVTDLALIGGYRFDNLMIYGGPFLLWDIAQTDYNPGALTQKKTMRVYGANLGLEVLLNEMYARAEFAGTKSRLGTMNVGKGTYGIAAGVRF